MIIFICLCSGDYEVRMLIFVSVFIIIFGGVLMINFCDVFMVIDVDVSNVVLLVGGVW